MTKTTPKIITLFFLLVFILQIASLIFLFLLPSPIQAINFTPQVDIGANVQVIGGNSIGEYIRAIYNYAIGVVGILATVVMMIGGIVWITAGGNQTRVSEAKAWIGASLSGLVLALASYTILAAVSPNLVNFKPVKIAKPVAQDVSAACCLYYNDIQLTNACVNTNVDECKNKYQGTPTPGGTCVDNSCVSNNDMGCCQLYSSSVPFNYCTDNIPRSSCKSGLWPIGFPQTYQYNFLKGKGCKNNCMLNEQCCL